MSKSMKLIQHDRDSFHVELMELVDVERPPIATLPEYRAARAAGSGVEGTPDPRPLTPNPLEVR
jgi:hypothetical protein